MNYEQRDRNFRKRKKRKKKIVKMICQAMLKTMIGIIGLIICFLAICGCLYLYDKKGSHGLSAEKYVAAAGKTLGKEPDAIIVVDAGHGGKDQGTSAGSILEKDINLAVAQSLKNILTKNNIQVILTRDTDEFIRLSDRAKTANRAEADYFLSIHCNYCEESSMPKGLECYFREGSNGGEHLAQAIIDACEEVDEIENRGIKTEDFSVLRNTKMAAVLIELGYLSNSEECKKLGTMEYQEKIAEQIAKGICSVAQDPSPT